MKISEAALAELKVRNPCEKIAGEIVRLRRKGRGFIGPCPLHSPDPQARDSTSFECDAESWKCAVCHDGGDVIALVQKLHNLDFRAAVERLGGAKEIDPAEAARIAAIAAKKREARDAEAARYRERERSALFRLWNKAEAVTTRSSAGIYLARRGVPAIAGARLRVGERTAYYSAGSPPKPLWRGSCMLAAIIGANDRFAGLHFTYLDPEKPSGKAEIHDPETGEILPAKKVRGSKQAGRIELVRVKDPKRLILGEGIETVLSVWHALKELGRDLSATAFWSAVDLGNLGGKAKETVAHPSLKATAGRPQRVPGPEPDLTAAAIPIPDSVNEIILLGDGDSDPFLTRCALDRAAARCAREGRTIRIAWAPEGQDFNDILRSAA